MMRFTVLVIIFSFWGISDLCAQFLEYDMIQVPQLRHTPVYNRLSSQNQDPSAILSTRKLRGLAIDNPSVRYAIQNLEKEYATDPEMQNALRTISRYAEDEQLKYIISYLRKYAEGNASREKALGMLDQQITYDSIQFYADNRPLVTQGMKQYINTDLQTLVSYIRNDSNYIWMQNSTRDSSLLEVMSIADQTVRFWINNGQNNYYRFWAANKQGDTIGTWIQVLPEGNRLRIYVDEDVAPTRIEKKKSVQNVAIQNKLADSYFKLREVTVGELHRRYWTYYSEVELAMSQGALINWASGGDNTLNLLSNVRYFWNYNRNKTSWENWVHYRFGFTRNGKDDVRKNEDRFELNSKLGQRAFKHWYYTAQFNMLTQLFNSYDYPKDKDKVLVANFMSPGYFTLSLGLDYKPNDNFSLFISPITGKWNFVRDTADVPAKRYGITEEGKRSVRNAGARLDLRSSVKDLFKIMGIRNELTFFMSYEEKDRYKNKGKKDEEKKSFAGTVNWKLTLDFKINYFMRASIYTETVYDENYDKKVQFKENLNLGVNFRF